MGRWVGGWVCPYDNLQVSYQRAKPSLQHVLKLVPGSSDRTDGGHGSGNKAKK